MDSSRYKLLCGDCIDEMKEMPENSVDAIVTDPPYGLEFMGKDWDSFRTDPRAARWSAEKSGGAGARIDEPDAKAGDAHGRVSYHKRRTTSLCRSCGKRDAFRNPHACGDAADWTTIPVDRIPMEARAFQNWTEMWALEAYRVLKPGGHLLAFGGSRTHHRMIAGVEDAGFDIRDCLMWLYGSGFPKSYNVELALSKNDAAAAERWKGWGTALKPAWEAVVLARKPLGERSIAENVLKHGTGALNVNGCRGQDGDDVGRWPANIMLDEEAAELLDQQSGDSVTPDTVSRGKSRTGNAYSIGASEEVVRDIPCFGDFGGASRFFYVAKVDSNERNSGLETFPVRLVNEAVKPEDPGFKSPRKGAAPARNHHPTVKPISLMAWLVKLITPPGGVVLDPFMGSGSTGMAALRQGFQFLGIEREPDYIAIARRRIEEDAPLFQRPTESPPSTEPEPDPAQMDLLT